MYLSDQEEVKRIESLEKGLTALLSQLDGFVQNIKAVLDNHRLALDALGGAVDEIQKERLRQREEFFYKLLFYAEKFQERPM
jgi:hypothetical protein